MFTQTTVTRTTTEEMPTEHDAKTMAEHREFIGRLLRGQCRKGRVSDSKYEFGKTLKRGRVVGSIISTVTNFEETVKLVLKNSPDRRTAYANVIGEASSSWKRVKDHTSEHPMDFQGKLFRDYLECFMVDAIPGLFPEFIKEDKKVEKPKAEKIVFTSEALPSIGSALLKMASKLFSNKRS